MTDPSATVGSATRAAAAVTLTLSDLTRDFAGRRVLGPVDLRVDAGVLAVIGGPNGAGKTTLLRIAAGLLAPSGGIRSCAGRAVYARPGAGARHHLRVGQALAQTAALTGTPVSRLEEISVAAGLGGVSDRRVGELSSGQQARLTVALVAATGPSLACLDEPTAHLDPAGVEQVRAVVRRLLSRGTALLVVSHSPEQFAGLGHAMLRLEDGQLREARC